MGNSRLVHFKQYFLKIQGLRSGHGIGIRQSRKSVVNGSDHPYLKIGLSENTLNQVCNRRFTVGTGYGGQMHVL